MMNYKRKINYKKNILCAVSACLITAPISSIADVKVSGNMPMPASLFMESTFDACDNNQGPYITMGGDVTLDGLGGKLRFSNNSRGTHEHEEDVKVAVEFLKNGEQIKFNKQPSRGGVGGNPWIYAQFFHNSGEQITDEMLLGRCVQGISTTALTFALASAASVNIAGGSCSGQGGTEMNMSGDITLSGINANLIFRNNEKGTHEYSEDDVTINIQILPDGDTISFDKRPPQGGAGGNPHVYFQFTDGKSAGIGTEMYLGRCNKL